MLKIIVSCILTGIISVIIGYYLNIYLGNRREKNKLVYDQLKEYASKLSLVAEKWVEFTEIMDSWNKERNESVAPIYWKKSLNQMNKIEDCFTEYRATVHRTEQIISNNFNDGDMFVKSVYSMTLTKNDEYNEAHFFNVSTNDFQGATKGKEVCPNEKQAYETMNNIYGTYIMVYKYRVQTKLSKAQAYIDQKLQVVADSISAHKFNKK